MDAHDIPGDDDEHVRFGGVKVHKASVAGFLANAAFLSRPDAPREVQDAALRDIFDALPTLRAIGLFDVLEIKDPRLRAFVNASLQSSLPLAEETAMHLDQTRFPLVFMRADTPSGLSYEAQMEALLGREAPFVLIAEAQADHDHGEETPEMRRQRALAFKAIRGRLRRLCRGTVVIQGGKPPPPPFRLAAEGFSKAVGVTVRFVDDEASAIATATAMLGEAA